MIKKNKIWSSGPSVCLRTSSARVYNNKPLYTGWYRYIRVHRASVCVYIWLQVDLVLYGLVFQSYICLSLSLTLSVPANHRNNNMISSAVHLRCEWLTAWLLFSTRDDNENGWTALRGNVISIFTCTPSTIL
jgi:hypothetical protein